MSRKKRVAESKRGKKKMAHPDFKNCRMVLPNSDLWFELQSRGWG